MNIITYFFEFYLLIKEAIDQVLITKPIDSRKIVLDKKSFVPSLLDFIIAARFPATIAAPTPKIKRIIVKSNAKGSSISYIMIKNMFEVNKIVDLFLKYEISSEKDTNNYSIRPMHGGITNISLIVTVNSFNYVIRIPGNNPDVINRKAEKHNMLKAEELGITLPSIIFDDDSGIKISEYFNIYTYTKLDFQDKTMRGNALKKIKQLHESNVIFEENFSPLTVFRNIVDESSNLEKEAKEVGDNIIKKLKEIGTESRPCHQDLYHGNFIIYKNETLLIDWEYSSMGDTYFDYADLFWQNDFDRNLNFRKKTLEEIGITSIENIEKFEYFEMLSMITWGLWAMRRSPNDSDGKTALNKAIMLLENKN